DLLFTGTGTPPVISVLRNLGDGLFGERGDSYTTQSFGTVIGDVDGDGAGDLLGIEPEQSGPLNTRAANILFRLGHFPTPALASCASATASFDGATLIWWISSDGPSVVSIERRPAGGAWITLAQRPGSIGELTYEDRAVTAGARYEWRLSWEEGGATHHSAV